VPRLTQRYACVANITHHTNRFGPAAFTTQVELLVRTPQPRPEAVGCMPLLGEVIRRKRAPLPPSKPSIAPNPNLNVQVNKSRSTPSCCCATTMNWHLRSRVVDCCMSRIEFYAQEPKQFQHLHTSGETIVDPEI
jgi:hypothetical protein